MAKSGSPEGVADDDARPHSTARPRRDLLGVVYEDDGPKFLGGYQISSRRFTGRSVLLTILLTHLPARHTTRWLLSYGSEAGQRTGRPSSVPGHTEQHVESTTFNPSVLGSLPPFCRHRFKCSPTFRPRSCPMLHLLRKQILRRRVLAEPSGSARTTVCKLDSLVKTRFEEVPAL